MNSDCAVALGWKPEGKKSRGRPKTTDRNDTHGQERGRQQATSSCGEKMFGPCVPPGIRRFNLGPIHQNSPSPMLGPNFGTSLAMKLEQLGKCHLNFSLKYGFRHFMVLFSLSVVLFHH